MPPELQEDLLESANQIPEGGVQDEAVINDAVQDDAAQDSVIPDAVGDAQQKSTKEEEGLKAGIVAEQQKVKALKEQIAAIEAQNQVLMQQMQQSQLQQMQKQQQIQRDPNELMTYGEFQQQQAMLMQQMQLQNIRTQLTDVDELIGINTGSMAYQPSDYVKKFVQANPSLGNITQFIAAGNPQAITMVYSWAKQQKELDTLKSQQQAFQEQQNLQNAANKTNVMSPAAAGGAGSVNAVNQMPADENSDEFARYIAEIKAGKYDTR